MINKNALATIASEINEARQLLRAAAMRIQTLGAERDAKAAEHGGDAFQSLGIAPIVAGLLEYSKDESPLPIDAGQLLRIVPDAQARAHEVCRAFGGPSSLFVAGVATEALARQLIETSIDPRPAIERKREEYAQAHREYEAKIELGKKRLAARLEREARERDALTQANYERSIQEAAAAKLAEEREHQQREIREALAELERQAS